MDDDEREELRGQVRKERQLRRMWGEHPDPRDPDYPYDYDDEDEGNE